MGLDMHLLATAEAPGDSLRARLGDAGILRNEDNWGSWNDEETEPRRRNPDPSFDVAYWRKANAIHGWFVDTLAGGVDECQTIPVARGALMDLVERCRLILAAADEDLPDVAEATGITPRQGFFFGSTQYGEWYREYLQETVDQVTKILDADLPGVSYFYKASW